jgi:hypothetical protein
MAKTRKSDEHVAPVADSTRPSVGELGRDNAEKAAKKLPYKLRHEQVAEEE